MQPPGFKHLPLQIKHLKAGDKIMTFEPLDRIGPNSPTPEQLKYAAFEVVVSDPVKGEKKGQWDVRVRFVEEPWHHALDENPGGDPSWTPDSRKSYVYTMSSFMNEAYGQQVFSRAPTPSEIAEPKAPQP